VGEEVHARFTSYAPGATRGRNLDMKRIARAQLERSGVGAVRDVGVCTICSEDFFSHRRDGGITGRQAGVVWLS
jgi:polyphenol oxidase